MTFDATGVEKRSPNKEYWQGVYELLRASIEAAKQDPSKAQVVPEARDWLKKLLVLYPDPPLYKDEFKKLHDEATARLGSHGCAGHAPDH